MNVNFKKYRPFIYLLWMFYINFFLFAPYTHPHHDLLSLDEDIVILHSHIFAGHEEDHNPEKPPQHLDENSNHQHLTYTSTFQFTRIAKTLRNILSDETYSIINYQYKALAFESEKRIVVDLPSKLHWERYVYSASNLSPPTV
jgi:hypothetical protein